MCDKAPEGIFEKKVARGQMVKIMDEIWQEEYKQVYEDLRFRTRSMWILLSIYLTIIGVLFYALSGYWRPNNEGYLIRILLGSIGCMVSFYFLIQITAERKNWSVSIKRLEELECILLPKEYSEKLDPCKERITDYKKRGRFTGYKEIFAKADKTSDKKWWSQYCKCLPGYRVRRGSAFAFMVFMIFAIILSWLVLILWPIDNWKKLIIVVTIFFSVFLLYFKTIEKPSKKS